MKIISPDFKENAYIPVNFTCDGDDVSPSIDWQNCPPESKSVALIMEELDSPKGSFVHWLLYNWRPDSAHVDKKLPRSEVLKNGARQGLNDFDQVGYSGPCPTAGTHKYVFRLYALDQELNLSAGAHKDELLKAMRGHVLAESKFFANYSREKAFKANRN